MSCDLDNGGVRFIEGLERVRKEMNVGFFLASTLVHFGGFSGFELCSSRWVGRAVCQRASQQIQINFNMLG